MLTPAALFPPLNWKRCGIALLFSLGLHASLVWFFAHRPGTFQPAEYGIEAADSSVDETLVAAPSVEASLVAFTDLPEPELEPTPPPVEPEPTPLLEEEETPPPEAQELDFIDPAPAPVRLPEKPLPKPTLAAKPRPPLTPPTTTPPRTMGDGSSARPGNDAATLTARAGATSSPTYLRNPAPSYPSTARSAGQQGVVRLRVSISAQGRPASVRVERSSGFPLLDDAARSTVADRWLFKPPLANGVAVATELVIPVRFDLKKG